MNMMGTGDDNRERKEDRNLPGELEQRESTVSMQDIYDQTFKDILEGEIVKGKVLDVGTDSIVIDIGYKSEGTIPIKEFLTPQGQLEIQVGDDVEVYLESKEDNEGIIVLSNKGGIDCGHWSPGIPPRVPGRPASCTRS
jgi:small subunit ribosomal protein S1